MGGQTNSPAVPFFEEQARRLLSRRFLMGLFVPDISIRFWRKHREHALKRVRAIQPEVIITTSPPHSIHDLGLWLAAQTGIPWVADFRDPYLIDDRFRPMGLGLLRLRAHLRFAAAIYRRAWLITHAIPIQARWAGWRLPFARERIRVLTNAFPTELLEDLEKEKGERRREKEGEGRRDNGTTGLPDQGLSVQYSVSSVQSSEVRNRDSGLRTQDAGVRTVLVTG